MKKFVTATALAISLSLSPVFAEKFEIKLTPIAENDRGAAIAEYKEIQRGLRSMGQKGGDPELLQLKKILRFSEKETIQANLLSWLEPLVELEGKILSPTKEDFDLFREFLLTPNTGLSRIFPADQDDPTIPSGGTPYDFVFTRGGGSFFQFKDRSHLYGYGSDITYRTFSTDEMLDYAYFRVGFVDKQLGFLGELGLADIRNLDLTHPIIQFARAYTPPVEVKDWDKEDALFWDNIVTMFNPFSTREENAEITRKDVSPKVPALVGATYVVRSMIAERYDVTTVFQVVRKDPVDGSIIIAWKVLDDVEIPQRKMPALSKSSGFDGFPGLDGRDGNVEINVGGQKQEFGFPNVVSTKAKYKFLLSSTEYINRKQ